MKKDNLTFFSKGMIYLAGFGVLAIGGILAPEIAREEAAANPDAGPAWPFLMAVWGLMVPVLAGLRQAHVLVSLVDQNRAFSVKAVRALQNIKTCIVIFGALVAAGALALIVWGRSVGEDVAPVFTLGGVVLAVTGVMTVFVAVLKRLLQEAMEIKAENDQIV